MRLGILDLGSFDPNRTNPLDRITQTINAVQKAEELNYCRYWLGEHFDFDVAWRCPDVLLPLLAGLTNKIKVGSAGVLMRYHRPFTIAHNYKLLNNLFSKRIELGFSKGLVPEQYNKLIATTNQYDLEQFYANVLETKKYLDEGHYPCDIPIIPYNQNIPDLWLLGSSASTIDFALQNNMNFCISLCHKPMSEEELKTVSDKIASKRTILTEKNISHSLLASIICSDTKEKAISIQNGNAHECLFHNSVGSHADNFDYLSKITTQFLTNEVIIPDLYVLDEDRINAMHLLSQHIDS
jgi:alkanesulfonate monooxygenase SsuD/methylene tetrahydromethanopterin reductase-like flavin-dependent oxidoreductase (luciferase family)